MLEVEVLWLVSYSGLHVSIDDMYKHFCIYVIKAWIDYTTAVVQALAAFVSEHERRILEGSCNCAYASSEGF